MGCCKIVLSKSQWILEMAELCWTGFQADSVQCLCFWMPLKNEENVSLKQHKFELCWDQWVLMQTAWLMESEVRNYMELKPEGLVRWSPYTCHVAFPLNSQSINWVRACARCTQEYSSPKCYFHSPHPPIITEWFTIRNILPI